MRLDVHTSSWRPKWHNAWRLNAFAIDLVAVAIGLLGSGVARFGWTYLRIGWHPLSFAAPWELVLPAWPLAFAMLRLYHPERCRNALEEARGIAMGSLAAPIGAVLAGFVIKQDFSRTWLALSALTCLGTASAGRRFLRFQLARQRLYGRWVTDVVVVGRAAGIRSVEQIRSYPTQGWRTVATVGFTADDLPSYPDAGAALIATRASGVVIAGEDLDRAQIRETINVANHYPVNVYLLPGLDFTMTNTVYVVPIGSEPALSLEVPALRPQQRFLKRMMDVVVSLVVALTTLPLLLLVALAIRLETRGNAIFKQQRAGLHGRPFTTWKFRTMRDDAHESRTDLTNEAEGPLFKVRDDPRRTRVGRWLRRFSLDELPQLWNVLKGDMSLVGPRPALLSEVEGYDVLLLRRLAVRPGMTGLWQVSGRADLPFEDYVRLDVTYVQNWTLLLDFYILLRTIPAIVHGRGAY